jgi:NDP-sugar pyrophosphorylase family protein
LNGDTYLPIDYQAMARHFEGCQALGLMALYDNAETVAPNNVEVVPDGTVARYATDGRPGLTHVAAGAYLFRKQIMERIPVGVSSSLEADLTPDLVGSKDLDAYLVDRPFYDIGTFERLALAGCALPHPSESS